jgi:hypothetical protein
LAKHQAELLPGGCHAEVAGGDDAMREAASKITTTIAGAGKRTAGRLVHRPIAVDAWLLQALYASRNATLGRPSLQGGRAKYTLTQWSVVAGGYFRHLRACRASDALKLRSSGEKPQNLGFITSTNFRP